MSGEGPPHIRPGQAGLHVRVGRDIQRVVVVNEATLEDGPICRHREGSHQHREQQDTTGSKR